MTRSNDMLARLARGKAILAVFTLLLLAVIAACGETGSESDSPTASIAFDKESVELRGAGGVSGDQVVEETFLIVNQGQTTLQVGPPSITRITGCDSAYTTEDGTSLPPGEMARLGVQVVGHDHPGPHGVELSVPSGDPLKPLTTLRVNFEVRDEIEDGVRGPRLSVDKETIDIGAVPYDGPLYERFMLHNSGDEPLHLDGLPEVRTEDGC